MFLKNLQQVKTIPTNFYCSKNRHCRRGVIGGYRNEMSNEWIKQFDEWTKNKLQGFDFEYAA